jgi:phospholipid transport system substrate-binding protein
MKVFFLAVLMFLPAWVCAEENPSTLVRDTSEQVRTILMKENGSNTDVVRAEVEQLIFPRFDFLRMTALAVGKNWKQADEAQKQALIAEFRTLLTRTYFSVMLRYRDVKVVIKPDVLLENEGKQATVKTQVDVANGTPPVSIDYVLYHTAEGWKVFNVSVEGASLVTVYRNQFGDEVSKGGVEGLLQSLRSKNQASATQSADAAVAPSKS